MNHSLQCAEDLFLFVFVSLFLWHPPPVLYIALISVSVVDFFFASHGENIQRLDLSPLQPAMLSGFTHYAHTVLQTARMKIDPCMFSDYVKLRNPL